MRKKTKKNTLLKLYQKMLLIRMTEEYIADIYPNGEMKTPTHLSIGQEAVSVGVCERLKKDDYVFATHRGHAAYLSKGGALKPMISELFGRANGSCGGRSGSAHLSSPEVNMFSAPILGGMIPVAAGVAMAFSLDRKKNVAVIFLGDAALEEGVFMETVNLSILKDLPVLFVCENNQFSTHTHIKYRQTESPIYKRVRACGMLSEQLDGNNVIGIFNAAGDMLDRIRSESRPAFMECHTYRYREHVGPNYDFYNPYRTKKEVEYWMDRCPIKRMEKYLTGNNVVSDIYLKKSRQKIKARIKDAVNCARRSKWPDNKELLKHVV